MPTAQPTNPTDMEVGRAKAIAAAAWRIEDGLTAGALALMALLPAIEPVLRTLFAVGIPGNSGYVQNLTLWVAYLGAMVATRDGRHLDLSTGMLHLPPPVKRVARHLVAFVSTAVAAGLLWASFQFVEAETAVPLRIGGWMPIALAEAILPVAFAAMMLRFALAGPSWGERAVGGLGIVAAAIIGFLLAPYAGLLLWPAIVVLVAAAFLGAP